MKVLQFVRKAEKKTAATGMTAIAFGFADNYDYTGNY